MKKTAKVKIVVAVCTGVFLFSACAKAEITDNYEGTHWFEEVQTDSTETPLLEEWSFDSMADSWMYGSVYAPGSIVTADEDYFYVVNYTDGGKIYKISKTDFTNSRALTEFSGDQVNVVDDGVIFASEGDVTARNGIYSVDKDGKNLVLLTTMIPIDLQVVNDWAYFADSNGTGIYKLNYKTREQIRLFDEGCNSIVVSGNSIVFSVYYYTQNHNTFTSGSENYIGKIDVNGNNLVKSDEKSDAGYLKVFGNSEKLYYTDSSYGIKSLNHETLTGTDMIEQTSLGNEQVTNEALYFVSEKNDRQIGCIRFDDNKEEYSSFSKVFKYAVFDNLILVVNNMEVKPKVGVHNLQTGDAIDFFSNK